MGALHSRVKSKKYKNWVKAALCLTLVKEGLEEFADRKSKQLHRAVLTNVAKIQPARAFVCDNEKITFGNKTKIDCNHQFCQGFLQAIVQEGIDQTTNFTIQTKNVRNCNVKLWHSAPWELAKLFMNIGQTSIQQPSETDLSGILNFLDHCLVPRNDIQQIQFIDMVRQARNEIMHTADMKLSDTDFQHFTQSMVNLLQDPKQLASMPSAQKAAKEILAVSKADFQISLEDESVVIKELTAALHKATEDTKIEARELRSFYDNLQQAKGEEEKKLHAQIQQLEDKTNKVADSLAALTKLVSNNKVLLDRVGPEVKCIHGSLEQAKEDLWSAHNDIKRRLGELEQKSVDAAQERTVLYSRHAKLESETSAIKEDVSAHSNRLTQLESTKTPTIGDEDCRKLRVDLVEEYSRIYKDISLSPLGDGLNDEALRVPIDKIYCDLDIVKIKGNKQPELESEDGLEWLRPLPPSLPPSPLLRPPRPPLADRGREKAYAFLYSYSEMFSDKEIKNIVVKGEGGTGKSTWCKRLLHAWCQVQRRALGMKGAKFGDEANTDMEESLKRFDYLLYVTLRHVKHQSSLKDIIFSACLERLSMQRNVCELILANFSENVLILLDGFDEYPFTLDCQGLGQSTIVMTTRPWKYDKLLETDNTFKVDAVSEIRGLTKQGVKELSKKVISSYNKQYPDMGSDSSNEKEQTSKFLYDIRSAELSDGIRIPLILIITALTWLENKSLSKSLTYNILGLLQVLFRRGVNKLSPTNKATLERVELGKQGTSIFHKSLTGKYKFMRDNQVLLKHLGRLAYKGLTNQKKGLSLVFTEDELHEFLAPDELEICYNLGLLTGSTVTTSLLEPPQVSISFYHKLMQELFAAISIISDSDNILSEFNHILVSLTAVFEMENVILFITGLNPSIGSDLSEHFVGLADTDDWVCDSRRRHDESGMLGNYSELLFKCMLEWDIVHERKEQKRLYLTDLIITSDFDKKLRLCTYHNREHLKSLTVRVDPPYESDPYESDPCESDPYESDPCESVNIIQILSQLTHESDPYESDPYESDPYESDPCESVNIIPILSQLTTLTRSATALQSLDINVERVRCEGINTIDTTHFDLTSSVHLESISIKGIQLSNEQHFLSVTFGKTVQLREVKIENAVINTLYLQNNTELKLKDVKVSEIRLPTRLEKLEDVSLQSVTMPGPSWNSFFQSLQSPSLTKLKLKNLNIDDITIILETCSGLVWLDLEDVKVSEIRLPTRLEQLKDVTLESVTMPGPSWNSFFQSLQSPSLWRLTLRNLNTDDITIILETCSGLVWLDLEDVKVSEIRLPTRKKLRFVSLQSVTMPGPSWNSFFQSLQSPSLTELKLKNLHIDDIFIRLFNCEELVHIEISNVKLAGIDISSTEILRTVKVDEVVFPESQSSSFFNQVLQSKALAKLTMKNISLGEERVRFDSWDCGETVRFNRWRLNRWRQRLDEQPNIQIQVENVSMSQKSYKCLCTLLKTLKCSKNEVTKHSIDKGLLNVTVVKKVHVYFKQDYALF